MKVDHHDVTLLGNEVHDRRVLVVDHVTQFVDFLTTTDFNSPKENYAALGHLFAMLPILAEAMVAGSWQAIVKKLIEASPDGSAENKDVALALQSLTNALTSLQDRPNPNGRIADAFTLLYSASFATAAAQCAMLNTAADATDAMFEDLKPGSFAKFLGGDRAIGRDLLNKAVESMAANGIKMQPTTQADLDRLFDSPSLTATEAGIIAEGLAERLGLDPRNLRSAHELPNGEGIVMQFITPGGEEIRLPEADVGGTKTGRFQPTKRSVPRYPAQDTSPRAG